jgi:RES domain-containing protein
VALDPFLATWSADVYRHIPAGAGFDVLGLRWAGSTPDNRWNTAEEPTLYVAGDHGVMVGEFARHLHTRWSPALGSQTSVRQIYRLHVEIERMLDLRDPRVLDALSVENAPQCFLDKRIAQVVARYLRLVTRTQGIIVPSMVFLDDLDRWTGVLFLEKLPGDPRAFVTAVEDAGGFRLDT